MPGPRYVLSAGAGMAQSASGWRSQRCLFMHTVQEQREVPLRKEDQDMFRFVEETRVEVGTLRNAVVRLAASMMWERGAVRAGDAPAPRTAEQVVEPVREVSSQDRDQQRLVKRLVEVCEFSRKVELFSDFLEPRMTEQLVDVPKIVVELTVPSGKAESYGPEACNTTSAATTAVAKSAGEARPPGIAKQCASTKSQIAVSSGEAGFPSPEKDTTSADAAAVAKPVGEARPPGIAKYSASTECEFAKSPDEAGSSRTPQGQERKPSIKSYKKKLHREEQARQQVCESLRNIGRLRSQIRDAGATVQV